jgi:hypothetical protein
MSHFYGQPVWHGAAPELLTKPIQNLPAGTLKVRRRIRPNSVMMIMVKTATGITRHNAYRDGDQLFLGPILAANQEDQQP